MGSDKEQSKVPGMIREGVTAVFLVLLVVLATFVYTSNWPPLVVIESGSMMHDSEGSLGYIDPADMVLVEEVGNMDDVTTFADVEYGSGEDYQRYGRAGDVIIYRKNGDENQTPVIHRAMARFADGSVAGTYTLLPVEVCGDEPQQCTDQSSFGTNGNPIVIEIPDGGEIVLCNFAPGWAGFLTLGDNNGNSFDQAGRNDASCGTGGGLGSVGGQPVGPAALDHIQGVARGEIPWFGYGKLATGSSGTAEVTDKSMTLFWVWLAVLVVVPFMFDMIRPYLRRGARPENIVAEVEPLIEQERYIEALRLVRRGLREHPDEPTLRGLRKRLAAETD